MEDNKIIAILIILAGLLCGNSPASAAPGADIKYHEINIGNGLWLYDYTVDNTSTMGESIFELYLDFPETDINGLPLPEGWDYSVWEGWNYGATYLNAFSTAPFFDIYANGSLDGFSFISAARIGDISYTAYFDDWSFLSGNTAVAPEPVSPVLLLTGGMFLLFRHCLSRHI